jgi:Cu/Zn superoxide dismutase
MYSSFAFVFLTILISNLSWTVFAGDYPIIGVVLLQSVPRSDAFGTATITQQFEGNLFIFVYCYQFNFYFFIGGPLVVEGIIFNLKPNSRFGLHVHEKGDITNACQSTGSHFNPYAKDVGSIRVFSKKVLCYFFLAW